MKKIWFLILFFLFAGCTNRADPTKIQAYSNELMNIQHQAVKLLEEYYATLEQRYTGDNLSTLYETTQTKLKELQNQVTTLSAEDSEFHLAVVTYLSGLQDAFMQYETPVIHALGTFSGDRTLFYEEERKRLTLSTMTFWSQLAQLDKAFEQAYQNFLEKYSN